MSATGRPNPSSITNAPSVTRGRTCPLGKCDGSGFLYDEGTNTSTDCQCRPQIVVAGQARSLSATIPARYKDAAFDRFPVTEMDPQVVSVVRRYTENIDSMLDAGEGLWLIGPVGTGKTTLAMIATMAALKAGRSAARYSMPSLLTLIKSTFDSGGHAELLERLCAVDLLHIDDIGAEKQTPWVLEELYSIVNSRYEEQRSMIITTNIGDRSELHEQITERTVSRLTQMCQELPLHGPDHRLDAFGDV